MYVQYLGMYVDKVMQVVAPTTYCVKGKSLKHTANPVPSPSLHPPSAPPLPPQCGSQKIPKLAARHTPELQCQWANDAKPCNPSEVSMYEDAKTGGQGAVHRDQGTGIKGKSARGSGAEEVKLHKARLYKKQLVVLTNYGAQGAGWRAEKETNSFSSKRFQLD